MRVMRSRASGEITPARSVTYPWGAGIGGSTARAESADSATSAASKPPRRPALRIERVERVDDPLHLSQVFAELEALGAWHEAGDALAMVEQPRHEREGAEHALAGDERVAVARPGIGSQQPEQVAQEDEVALERFQHEPLEGAGGPAGPQVERAQAKELAARLLLALPAQRLPVDGEVREHVGPGEQAMLAPDVVELHGEDVAGPVEERPLDDQRDGEVPSLPPHDDGSERLQDVAGDLPHDDGEVHVGVWIEVVLARRAAVDGEADDLPAQRRLDFLAVRLELPVEPLVRLGHGVAGLIAARPPSSNRGCAARSP